MCSKRQYDLGLRIRVKNPLEIMTLDPQFRFRLATLLTIMSALIAGLFNVGSLYLFGFPLVPLAVSLIVLWTTKTSILKKVAATLIALLFVPVGFFIWVWWSGVSVHWNG